jgi:hypothetical protein
MTIGVKAEQRRKGRPMSTTLKSINPETQKALL